MEDLLTDIEAFCRAHGMSQSRFGRSAVNDSDLIGDLRAGRELRRGTVERVRQFMVTYRAEAA